MIHFETTPHQVIGGASLKYGADDLTRRVWQTSQTFDGSMLAPLSTVRVRQLWQKIWPQCLQCSLRLDPINSEWQPGHFSTSSSCCHLTCVSDSRIFSSWTWKYHSSGGRGFGIWGFLLVNFETAARNLSGRFRLCRALAEGTTRGSSVRCSDLPVVSARKQVSRHWFCGALARRHHLAPQLLNVFNWLPQSLHYTFPSALI